VRSQIASWSRERKDLPRVIRIVQEGLNNVFLEAPSFQAGYRAPTNAVLTPEVYSRRTAKPCHSRQREGRTAFEADLLKASVE